MKKFRFSNTWQAWSRVLVANKGCSEDTVEVNLTPSLLNSETWADVALIRIRRHNTPFFREDRESDELPDDVLSAMNTHIGEEVTRRLLTEDFCSDIDWDLYPSSGGGADMEQIRRR